MKSKIINTTAIYGFDGCNKPFQICEVKESDEKSAFSILANRYPKLKLTGYGRMRPAGYPTTALSTLAI